MVLSEKIKIKIHILLDTSILKVLDLLAAQSFKKMLLFLNSPQIQEV